MKNWKPFALGFFLAVLVLAFAVPAIAAGSSQTWNNVLVGGIRILLDGKTVQPKDAAGNPVDPVIYKGTTYLPVRAIASALGLTVDWEGSTKTVILTSGNNTDRVSAQTPSDHGQTTASRTQITKTEEDPEYPFPPFSEMTPAPLDGNDLVHLTLTVGKKTEFTDYVYKNKDGERVFYYTGSGHSRIIIPDGVEGIYSFGPHADEITYVYIPHSVYIAYGRRFEWATGASYHDVLYECRNLQQVESDSILYLANADGTYVYASDGDGIWSKYEVFPLK